MPSDKIILEPICMPAKGSIEKRIQAAMTKRS